MATSASLETNCAVDVSFRERGRHIHRDRAGNQTQELLITSWTLFDPLSQLQRGSGSKSH